jgi:predicted Zn-dependent peptidase
MFQKTILKNGLRIFTVPMKNTEAVTVLVLVGTGSKYERKETNGISHFLEHLYFKGTKKRGTPIAVAETLDRVGGIYNAFTGDDYTGYFAKVSYYRLDLALDWVSDIFLNSILPEKEIDKERGVIIEEINMALDNPMYYIQELWSKLLYGDQPAGWPIAGTKENIKKISRNDLLDYRKNQYVATNTIVAVAGKIDSKGIIKKIENYFSKIKISNPQKKQNLLERQQKPKLLLYHKDTDQSHICFGVRAYNIFHHLKYAQELLSLILGGMMSSRLFTKVRGELGLAYYINTDATSNADSGYLLTQAGIDNRKIEKAVSVILEEYRRISKEKVSEDELQKAKDYFKGKMSLLLESSDQQAIFYTMQDILEKKILTPEEIFSKINKVTREDILKIAKDIFRPQKLNLAIIGPFRDKNKFQKLLKI